MTDPAELEEAAAMLRAARDENEARLRDAQEHASSRGVPSTRPCTPT